MIKYINIDCLLPGVSNQISLKLQSVTKVVVVYSLCTHNIFEVFVTFFCWFLSLSLFPFSIYLSYILVLSIVLRQIPLRSLLYLFVRLFCVQKLYHDRRRSRNFRRGGGWGSNLSKNFDKQKGKTYKKGSSI